MTDIVVPGAVDALPVAPDPSTDSVLEFDAKANAMVAAQKTMVAQINDVAAKTRQNAIAANERATSADSAKQSAQTAATQAASAATQASSAAATATNKASEASSSADTARQYAQSIDPVALKDRANHTGTQAISTVSGLQAALDSKETPAGALAQIQAFGLGLDRFGDVAAGKLKVWPSQVGNTSPTTFVTAEGGDVQANSGHPVNGEGFSGISVSRGLRPIQMGVSGAGSAASCWYRGYTQASAVLSDWKRLADLNSPAFTGTPSAPSLKLGNVASTDVNTLDYYEEGAFTPSLRGKTTSGASTYSSQNGRYTRIGNRVFWEAQIILASWSGMVGQLQLSGLPFNVANDTGARGAVTIGYFAGLSSAELCDLGAFYNSNTASIDFLKRKLSESVRGAYPSEDLTQTAQIYLSGHYRVN